MFIPQNGNFYPLLWVFLYGWILYMYECLLRTQQCCKFWIIEPPHEIIALFILRKLILQTRMRSYPVGLDVWFLVRPLMYFHTTRVRTAKALARMRRLAWAIAGCLCDKYHNLMSWLIYFKILIFVEENGHKVFEGIHILKAYNFTVFAVSTVNKLISFY